MPVVRATSVEQAIAVLDREPAAVVVAGGTAVMVDIAEGRLDPELLVTLRRVPELHGIHHDGLRRRVGALTTYSDLLAATGLPLLTAAAYAVGSPAQRNAGTVGGGLVSGRGGDLATALLALDADVEVCDSQGRSTVALQDWLHDERPPGEIVCSVGYLEPGGSSAYLKVGERQAVITASASAAVVVDAAGRVRVSIGGVASRAARIPEAERFASALTVPPTTSELEEFAELVRRGLGWTTHGSRVSAPHRRHVAGVLAARALARATASRS